MGAPSSFHFVICCFAMASLVFRGASQASRRTYKQMPEHKDKKMAADVMMTYYNVSAVTCALRCGSKYPCAAFSYRREGRVCTFCALCGNLTLVDAVGYRLYVLTDTSQQPAEPGTCPSGVVTPQKCWRHVPGLLIHVSVGPVGVWGVNRHHNIFHRTGTHGKPLSMGTAWPRPDGALVQIDVGRGTAWGVNRHSIYYNRQGVTASSHTGSSWASHHNNLRLRWISASPGGSLWGRNTADQVVHWHSAAWQGRGLTIRSVDAGLAGVWALNTTGHLFHRTGTYGDQGAAGTGWRGVEGGTFRSVSSGQSLVAAVDMADQVWLRTGLSPSSPTGLAWVRFPGSMRQIDVFQTREGLALWGVNAGQAIYYSLLKD